MNTGSRPGPAAGDPGKPEASFDAVAASYDATFTDTALGRVLRDAVWERLAASFSRGQRILEFACGTGEDAVQLARRGVAVLATDASAEMVEVARRKAQMAAVEDLVRVEHMSMERLYGGRNVLDRQFAEGGLFDGALSNFGGLNCIGDLPAFAHGLAASLRSGAAAVLCVMGPCVPWEWAWFLARLQPRAAFRRMRRGGCEWRGLRIAYPTPGAVRKAFGPCFRQTRLSALGALLPPTYAGAWGERHPRTLARLNAMERAIDTTPPLPWLSDHYLLELERR